MCACMILFSDLRKMMTNRMRLIVSLQSWQNPRLNPLDFTILHWSSQHYFISQHNVPLQVIYFISKIVSFEKHGKEYKVCVGTTIQTVFTTGVYTYM